MEIRKPIPVAEAVMHIMKHVKNLGTETIVLEQSMGRILAEPIVARHSVPPFNRSPYDGFAIRAEDSTGASGDNRLEFTVIGEIGAGYVGDRPVEKREAYRIMTGAQIPTGADAVVMFEQAVETESGLTVRKPFETGENISFKGEDAAEGDVLIDEGTLIHAGTIALLATFGYAEVSVYQQPVVGVLSTGTELLEVTDELVPGKIRNSNGPMVKAQLTRLGVPFESYGTSADDLAACTELVERALKETDALITTGGVSVGDYDYLPTIYERLGATVLFNKVAMRPGSVTTVAVLGDKFLFGLSGNPSACFTGFELFARPALLAMMGNRAPYLPHLQARLAEDFTKPNPFTRFVRAVWDMTENGLVAAPAGFNKSNAVSSIARGNCLIVLPSGSRGYSKGDKVDLLLIGSEQGAKDWVL